MSQFATAREIGGYEVTSSSLCFPLCSLCLCGEFLRPTTKTQRTQRKHEENQTETLPSSNMWPYEVLNPSPAHPFQGIGMETSFGRVNISMTDVASILLGPKGRPSLAQPIGLGSGARPFSRSEGPRFTPVARSASGRVKPFPARWAGLRKVGPLGQTGRSRFDRNWVAPSKSCAHTGASREGNKKKRIATNSHNPTNVPFGST